MLQVAVALSVVTSQVPQVWLASVGVQAFASVGFQAFASLGFQAFASFGFQALASFVFPPLAPLVFPPPLCPIKNVFSHTL
jgi:hypothetical protein